MLFDIYTPVHGEWRDKDGKLQRGTVDLAKSGQVEAATVELAIDAARTKFNRWPMVKPATETVQ